MTIFKIYCAAIGLAVASAGAANAATIGSYAATSAVSDPYTGSDHALWISPGVTDGIGADFDFVPSGLFTLTATGASLTGTVVSQDEPDAGFLVDFAFDDDYSDNPDPTPEFKSENESEPGPGTVYRDLEGGSLTGTGLLAGLDLAVTRLPESGQFVFQIGPSNGTNLGPNNKNMNFGMAGWFKISVLQANCIVCNEANGFRNLDGVQGDINVDLDMASVPLPAAGWLLVAAIGGLAALRRRKAG